MSDSLKQVGKVVGKTSKDITHTFTRQSQSQPSIERARDIFDPIYPYEMEFDVPANAIVTLSLVFNSPPPTGCCADCFCAICDEFRDSVIAEKTISFPFLSGSVRVFKNSDQITTFTETSSTDRQVTLDSAPLITDVIRICYIYKYTDKCTDNA